MARPYKARRICSVPTIDTFGPLNQEMDSAVELTLEEYETIRLIDWLDCTQEAVSYTHLYVDKKAFVNTEEAVCTELLLQGTDGACKGKCAFLCNHADGP